MNTTLTLLVFLATYTGIALGGIPGLALDRTGIALLGAIAMTLATGMGAGQALATIDTPTILLLYSLMLISAQFKLSGFYNRAALGVARLASRPRLFLAALMAVAAALSALLCNDIVCLVFTPILCVSLSRAGADPLPHVLGLAIASNIGSAATLIGNPQNMLLGQVGRLPFGPFISWSLVPVLLSLAGAYFLLLLLHRGRLPRRLPTPSDTSGTGPLPALNRWQAAKGIVVVSALLVLFLATRLPRELSALVLAGILLCSRRMKTRSLLGLIDWHLVTLFCGLFVVSGALAAAGLPDALLSSLASRGIDPFRPASLIGLTALLSNLVSNVPAVMLLVKFLPAHPHSHWYIVALASTFAGNLIIIGSIANLIVIEGAKEFGVKISWRRHAAIGVPVTILSLLFLYAWTLVA